LTRQGRRVNRGRAYMKLGAVTVWTTDSRVYGAAMSAAMLTREDWRGLGISLIRLTQSWA